MEDSEHKVLDFILTKDAKAGSKEIDLQAVARMLRRHANGKIKSTLVSGLMDLGMPAWFDGQSDSRLGFAVGVFCDIQKPILNSIAVGISTRGSNLALNTIRE